MRSLEKVAQEKGLVKPESLLQKLASRTAVKKIDATPTSNLMENIFKLCEGLKTQGLVAEANELEINYFQYKQAQTLYEAHKEKGEDVIHSAHPDGSHKLEGVEGSEACFEDILDKHVKFLQMIDKKPTGKLSSSAHVLSAVKKALGQTQSSAKGEMRQASADIQAALAMAEKGGGLTSIVMHWAQGRGEVVSEASTGVLSPDTINDAISAISALERNLHPNALHNYMPEFLNKGISTDALWGEISQKLSSAKSHCNAAITQLAHDMSRGISTDTSGDGKLNVPEVKVEGDPMSGKLSILIKKLQAFLAVRSISRNPQAKKWINDEIAEIQESQRRLAGLDPEQRKEIDAQIKSEVANFVNEVTQFYNQWVNVSGRA